MKWESKGKKERERERDIVILTKTCWTCGESGSFWFCNYQPYTTKIKMNTLIFLWIFIVCLLYRF